MNRNNIPSIQTLTDTLPQEGEVMWLGLRYERKIDLTEVPEVVALTESKLKGDHHSGKKGSKRQVTLIQQEHLNAVASYMKIQDLSPSIVRRNIVTQGINLLALKGKTFWIGEVLLKYTGECHPCSRMEENLGPGGYNAMRGHGGITAKIIQGGIIRIHDVLKINESEPNKKSPAGQGFWSKFF